MRFKINLVFFLFISIFLYSSNARSENIEYMQTGPMYGYDQSGFVIKKLKKVKVDFEKIEDKWYQLYYQSRNTMLSSDTVKRYFKSGEKNMCGIPVKPTDIANRQIHKAWSLIKGKGYYTLEKDGSKRKLDIEELIFECIKFVDGKSVIK